jgi:hypothetical protein
MDETTSDGPRGLTEEAPLSGTVLLDDQLEGAVGGRMPIGEEIPQ